MVASRATFMTLLLRRVGGQRLDDFIYIALHVHEFRQRIAPAILADSHTEINKQVERSLSNEIDRRSVQ